MPRLYFHDGKEKFKEERRIPVRRSSVIDELKKINRRKKNPKNSVTSGEKKRNRNRGKKEKKVNEN